MNFRDDISFEITEEIGTISERKHGSHQWAKELNVVAWNKAEPKFDIREWSEDHTHMSRGITLTRAEAMTLYDLLKNYFVKEVLER